MRDMFILTLLLMVANIAVAVPTASSTVMTSGMPGLYEMVGYPNNVLVLGESLTFSPQSPLCPGPAPSNSQLGDFLPHDNYESLQEFCVAEIGGGCRCVYDVNVGTRLACDPRRRVSRIPAINICQLLCMCTQAFPPLSIPGGGWGQGGAQGGTTLKNPVAVKVDSQ